MLKIGMLDHMSDTSQNTVNVPLSRRGARMESCGTPTIKLSHSLKAMPILMPQYCLVI